MTSAPAARTVLKPGLRVLHRDRDLLQVGLDPARAVRLPRTAAVRSTLDALVSDRGPAGCDPEVMERLARLGLLHDLPGPRPAGPGSPSEPTRLADRVAVRVGGPLPADVRAALAGSGLAVPPAAGSDPSPGPEREVLAEVGLLVAAGEPRRELLDDWLLRGLPHLVLRFTEGEALLGPYVVPGVTACLRCIDAHRTDADPRWPLLVAQQAQQVRRRDGVPDPVDALLARLAAAWAAGDLASSLRGAGPATWSTTLRLPVDLGGFEAVGWLRHPTCGCSLPAPPPHAGWVGR